MSMQTWFNAMELGRQHNREDEAIQRRNAFASLAQKAYAAPADQRAGIVGKAVGIDPAQGFALQENMQAGEDRQRQQLVNMARLLTSSPVEARSGIYQRIRPGLAQLGINAPATYEENPQLIDQTAEGLIQSNFAAAGNLRVQSTKVGEDGQIYNVMSNGAIMPTGVFAENRQQWVETTDAQGRPLAGPFNPRAGVLGGSPPAQQGSVQISPTGEAPMPDAATMQQIIQGIQSGRPFTVPAGGNAAPTATQGDLIRGRLPEEQAAAVTAAQEQARVNAELAAAQARAEAAAEAERLKKLAQMGAEREAQPLPADALKLVLDAEDKINGAASLQRRLSGWEEKIRTGRLQLSPALNARWEAELLTNNASPQAIEYGNFKSDLESIRNDVLRLNAGVQTEGDAQRAMNEILSNFGSGAYVMERLKTLANSNNRAVQFHRQQVDRINQNYNPTPRNAGGGAARPRAQNDAGEVVEWDGTNWVKVQ